MLRLAELPDDIQRLIHEMVAADRGKLALQLALMPTEIEVATEREKWDAISVLVKASPYLILRACRARDMLFQFAEEHDLSDWWHDEFDELQATLLRFFKQSELV